jgi:hypothetical protein
MARPIPCSPDNVPPLPHVIAHLLPLVAVHAHALDGVQQFQQQCQPGIGAVDACHRDAMALIAAFPGPGSAIGGLHMTNTL